MKTITYTLPAFWAPSLLNGDESGMEDSEIRALDKFLDWAVREHGHFNCIDSDDDSDFTNCHDASDFYPYACETFTFTFDIGG